MKEETLEEVLESSQCQFSIIENKLASLYRNQIKIYDSINKLHQQKYNYIDCEIVQITREEAQFITHYQSKSGELFTTKFIFEQFIKNNI